MHHELTWDVIIRLTFTCIIRLDWQEIDDLGVTGEWWDVERTSVLPYSEGTVLSCWNLFSSIWSMWWSQADYNTIPLDRHSHSPWNWGSGDCRTVGVWVSLLLVLAETMWRVKSTEDWTCESTSENSNDVHTYPPVTVTYTGRQVWRPHRT